MPEKRLRLSLSSTYANLESAVNQVRSFVQGLGLTESLAYTITLLASEAITNGMGHGNAWDVSRNVEVLIDASDDCIECCVSDQGDGFDPSDIDNPLEAEALMRGHGRGLHFMRTMADEFSVEDGGSKIRLRFFHSATR